MCIKMQYFTRNQIDLFMITMSVESDEDTHCKNRVDVAPPWIGENAHICSAYFHWYNWLKLRINSHRKFDHRGFIFLLYIFLAVDFVETLQFYCSCLCLQEDMSVRVSGMWTESGSAVSAAVSDALYRSVLPGEDVQRRHSETLSCCWLYLTGGYTWRTWVGGG